MSLQVLGRARSINVRKLLWLCDELGLEVQHQPWGEAGRPLRSPWFLALNPNGLVPVLVDGATVLWESNTCCRYLARRQGRTDLLPAEPAAQARVEQWMDWQATELNTAWRAAFMGLVRQDPAWQQPEAISASVRAWNAAMALLDAQLEKTGAHVAGAGFTLADVVLGLAAHRWRCTPLAHATLPAVQAWLQRLAPRPGFARWCTPELP